MKSKQARKTAVALHYDGYDAPRVTAKGTGITGEHIVQLAHKHGIPLHEDQGLATALASIPLGEAIPHELYIAVAEVLAFIYYLEGKQGTITTVAWLADSPRLSVCPRSHS